MKLTYENRVITDLEKHMKHDSRQKRVLLFEEHNMIHEERDLKQLLYLSKRGYDLERISEEMEHLTVHELILMSLHLCYKGKMKRFLLDWNI